MSDITAPHLRALIDNLHNATEAWNAATGVFYGSDLDHLEDANNQLAEASGAYRAALDDVRQWISRFSRERESVEVAASLERQDAFFRKTWKALS